MSRSQSTTTELPQLSEPERARYAWQMWTPGVGEAGQRKLKAARVLISRVGGVGGSAAYALAAAGVGKLILAHAGPIRLDDLNRQLLMTTSAVGTPRLDSAARRLTELNPHVEIEIVPGNICSSNAQALVERADLVIGAAPLFEERLAVNAAVVAQKKVLIDAAMYEWDARLAMFGPATPCLACSTPAPPPEWKRQFPVFGAVAATIGSMAAAEAIKWITGVGQSLLGRMLLCDLGSMQFRTVKMAFDPECAVCGGKSR